jgi:hypothetical protein
VYELALEHGIAVSVRTARRGWATAADVVNTRPPDAILAARQPW